MCMMIYEYIYMVQFLESSKEGLLKNRRPSNNRISLKNRTVFFCRPGMSLKKYSFLRTSCPELLKENSQEDIPTNNILATRRVHAHSFLVSLIIHNSLYSCRLISVGSFVTWKGMGSQVSKDKILKCDRWQDWLWGWSKLKIRTVTTRKRAAETHQSSWCHERTSTKQLTKSKDEISK